MSFTYNTAKPDSQVKQDRKTWGGGAHWVVYVEQEGVDFIIKTSGGPKNEYFSYFKEVHIYKWLYY